MIRIIKHFVTTIIISYLVISCVICQKSLAVTVPHLSITSTKYSVGNKIKEDINDINEIEVGNTLQLYAIISRGNEMLIDNNPDSLGWFVDAVVEDKVTWKSSNTSVATVDNTGKVTGKSAGKTTITVEYSGEEYTDNTSATFEVNVKKSNVDNPEEWTDISKMKVTYEWNGGSIVAYFSGITFKEKHTYSIQLSNSKQELENVISNGKIDSSEAFIISKYKDGRYGTTLKNSKMCLNEDAYLVLQESYFDSESNSHTKILTQIIKVERPALPDYGKRMDMFFVSTQNISSFLNIYNDTTIKRTVKYKIGKITNVDLLKTFQTNEKKAFTDLYSFAKNDSGIYSSSTILGSTDTANPTVKLNLDSNSYYYVYMIMDDENGKYYPIDDVAIYMGAADSTMVHFAFADMRFDSNSPLPGSSNDNTIAKGKLPYAGNIALGGSIIALALLVVYSIKKNNDFKDVK